MPFPYNPFNRRLARYGRSPALVAGLLVVGFVLSQFPQVAQWFKPADAESDTAVVESTTATTVVRVTKVFDGDTVELEDGRRVRLIGIDTPETEFSPRVQVEGVDDPFAQEAKRFLQEQCEGKTVRLEFGPEAEDKYGRTLAYLHLEDGTDLNAELLHKGLATAFRSFIHPRLSRYIKYETEARDKSLGLWAQ